MCKVGSLMLYLGRVGSSWGHRPFFGSSWGEKVITTNFFFKKIFFIYCNGHVLTSYWV
jgi:hypothetical protein